jgi:glycosyltransferase involved in cell wall biosynthesis
MEKRTKICFVGRAEYPLLSQKNMGSAGGAEVQQVLLAKELVKKGFDVSFTVADYGQKAIEVIDGIKIYKTYSHDSPVGIQYYPLKLGSILRALNKADADIYYKMTGGDGIVSSFCILKKKKVVYCIASDSQVNDTPFQKEVLEYSSPLDPLFKLLSKFGIKTANCVIAQNKYQQEKLKKNFNRGSILIKPLYILSEEKPDKSSIAPIVLWVSSMQKLKRPELFLKLAKAIPSARFQMIGGSGRSKKFYEQIEEAASKISNLNFIGFVPYHKIDQYFDKKSIFVNTSVFEGFSNTFLQAWGRYAPVVSLNVDPDEIICKYKLGFHSRTVEQMVEDVKLLLDDNMLREEMGMNGRRYVEREHDLGKILTDYEKLFHKL